MKNLLFCSCLLVDEFWKSANWFTWKAQSHLPLLFWKTYFSYTSFKVWKRLKIIAAESFVLNRRRAVGTKNCYTFLHCVRWHDTIGHNIMGILNLVWAVSSELVKTRSTLLLLWAGCDLGFWYGAQSVGYRYVTKYLQRWFEWKPFLPIFQ